MTIFNCHTSQAALIVIDLQNDLCRDARRADKFDAALPTILDLIETFRRTDSLVVYTRFELEADDPQFERFGDVYCVRGTSGCDLVPELGQLAGPVIPKHKHSAFYDTELDDLLRAHGVEEIVLCGLQTQICILLTAADAHHRGFRVTVADDAVISTQMEAKLDALDWIDRYVGQTASVGAIAAALR